MSRPSSRSNDQMREISIETNVTKHAEGSCMVKCGDTHVLCAATVEEKVPGWMRGIQAKVGSRRNMACCRRATHEPHGTARRPAESNLGVHKKFNVLSVVPCARLR